MPEITFKDGVLSSTVYVQVTRDYICDCGEELTLTLSLPEGVSFSSEISVSNVNCPACNKPVLIPRGHHYIENYKLLTKPLDGE